ncbi:RagB/SusD family nutrient uptake outer membrane protein [Arundinibacter roseus]|uniref:RagB/SusD family nutrient uptake outer membrane protein n=1 Tax=Arundinibacter roseus TaxID=2070510 RepID=A0A4R4K233_9BACT|nr:RagB/SusD family nutrient uptake outer membrane protein [Arundinibacter roseus]TDB61384.1 RagB/SusD family nutrient uptake outer membrane protein [Arundinibacter roseus]
MIRNPTIQSHLPKKPHVFFGQRKNTFRFLGILLAFLVSVSSCREILEPPPIDLLVDEFVLNEASDVDAVRLGLYNAYRGMGAFLVVAGDFTPDFVQFNGTFTVYNELANKQITATNAAAQGLWGAIYSTIYIANFIEERINEVPGVTEATRTRVLAEARFLRGFANFIGVYTFGDIPQVTTSDVTTNRTIPKTSRIEILASVLEDLTAALPDLPANNSNRITAKSFVTQNAARTALARYYLYQQSWAEAEQFATAVIASQIQTLPAAYSDVIFAEFDDETILEVAYANNSSDDPGTSTFGLNNVLRGRREVIPANTYVLTMLETNAGERRQTIAFNAQQQRGNDNGWSVVKYGSPDEANNNITIFRLAELYLIRAEARARQGRIGGSNGALADVNVLRTRAKAPAANFTTQDIALQVIERERIYELSFEGHRWYDLKRTGRIQNVMSAFSSNWDPKFELWPIPQSEIQRNPALSGQQNPGY